MSECRNKCGKEAVGRSAYCSKVCRALYSKRNQTEAQPGQSATIEAQPVESATVTESATSLPEEAYTSAEEAVNYRGIDCPSCLGDGPYRAAHCGPNCAAAQQRREQDKPEQPTMHERQCAANNQGRGKSEQHTVNTGTYKTLDKLDKMEHNRVSLPGDGDYAGCVPYSTSPIYGEVT
jgi:hypothetical protein